MFFVSDNLWPSSMIGTSTLYLNTFIGYKLKYKNKNKREKMPSCDTVLRKMLRKETDILYFVFIDKINTNAIYSMLYMPYISCTDIFAILD